jgi:DNA-binding response OmpR family regulator
VGKPFHYPELIARITAVLRRATGRRGQGALQIGELRIDPVAREVMLAGRRIELSAKEFALLRTLAAEPARVFTKEELLRDVWGFKAMGTSRTARRGQRDAESMVSSEPEGSSTAPSVRLRDTAGRAA